LARGTAIFGLLTPLPATPLYKRLEAAGRLTRPKHWQEFIPFEMAHTPLKMTIAEAHAEVKRVGYCVQPEAMAQAVDSLKRQALGYRINIFHRPHVFPGNLFPPNGSLAWLKLIYQKSPYDFQPRQGGFFHLARPGPRTRLATEALQTGVGAT